MAGPLFLASLFLSSVSPLVDRYTCAAVKRYYTTDLDSPSCCGRSDSTTASGVLANVSDVFYTFPIRMEFLGDQTPLCTVTFTPRGMTVMSYLAEGAHTFATPVFNAYTAELVRVQDNVYTYERTGGYFLDFHPMWEGETPLVSTVGFPMQHWPMEKMIVSVVWANATMFRWFIVLHPQTAAVAEDIRTSLGLRYYDESAGSLAYGWNAADPRYYAKRGYDTNPAWYVGTTVCPANDGTLGGWYILEDVVCFYEAAAGRRKLFVGSLYRSMEEGGVNGSTLARFEGVYWVDRDADVTGNVLTADELETQCTRTDTRPECAMYFWERVDTLTNKVTDIVNVEGTSIVGEIRARVADELSLWPDMVFTRNRSDFCDRAINQPVATRYVAEFPQVLTNLSATSPNVYDPSLLSHRMLCNLVEYPYYPDTSVRGSVDGTRLFDVFSVRVEGNRVFYTYGCSEGTGRLLSPRAYQPVYLVLLIELYQKYIEVLDDYDVTLDYTPQPFSEYPDVSEIPCVAIA